MPLIYEKKNIRGREGIEITSYDGRTKRVEVPEEINGLPVLSVGKSAFTDRELLSEVRLPSTLLSLGSFAFYHCSALSRISLYDSVLDYYDGATRTCRNLKEIEMTMQAENYVAVRRFLDDGDRKKRFLLHFRDHDLSLVFPEYTNEYVVDIVIKTHHATLSGSGFAYRECLHADGIRLAEYDGLFKRCLYEDPEAAVEIAVGRLCCPYGLSPEAAADYRSGLKESMDRALPMSFAPENEGWMETFMKEELLDEAHLDRALQMSSEKNLTVLTASLMEYRNRRFKKKKNVSLSFAGDGGWEL